MEWKIGNIKIKNQVGLAPMAGITNPAYLKICEEMGIGYSITELISTEAIVRNNKKTLEMLKGIDDLNIPVGIQIFGSNPETMKEAAKKLTELHKIKFIDINMGCPVPKVAVRAQAGAGLLKSKEKVFDIVKSVVEAVNIPVTVKIRSGWDKDSINAVEIAQIIEKAGASAVCVHPRTRSQGYTGNADWDIIKQVKESVKIPVIGNGDIKSSEDAKRMLEETKCDAIMIGRAALGNPWLLEDIVMFLDNKKHIKPPTSTEKISMCLKHINYLHQIKPEKVVVLESRNNIAWYLKGLPKANEIKKEVYQCSNIHDIIQVLNKYEEDLENEDKYQN